MKHLIFFTFLIYFLTSAVYSPLMPQDSTVSIVDRGSHYEVILDYTSGISHYYMGQQMAQKILKVLPGIEQMADSLLTETTATQEFYNICLNRMHDIKPQVPQEYIEEMNGLASILCSSSDNIRGDNKLSPDEFCLLELSDDVIRASQCSSVSVFGPRSETGSSIIGRVLDYPDGANHFQSRTQSVITIKNGSHSICMIGTFSIGTGTAFNDDGVFIALHDCPVPGSVYTSANKHSYIMDIRYVLENYSTLEEMVDFFTKKSKEYVTNRLIQLADKNRVVILENNFSGHGTNIRCALRSDTSALNPGITWGFPNAIATTNSFVLKGNYDNHLPALSSTRRWNSIKSQLQLYGEIISLNELKQIVSFDNGNGPGLQTDGDIYSDGTIQITLFQPEIFHLEIAFKPRSGILPTDPVFEEVPVYIGKSPTSAGCYRLPPTVYSLEQNYPNPFNPTTNFEFRISNFGLVTLKVYNVLGNEVATVVNMELAPGEYHFPFSTSRLPLSSGVYFYELKSGPFVQVKKFVLLK